MLQNETNKHFPPADTLLFDEHLMFHLCINIFSFTIQSIIFDMITLHKILSNVRLEIGK